MEGHSVDWTTVTVSGTIFSGIILALIKLVRDLVTKTVHQEFELLRVYLEEGDKAAAVRHRQHMAAMQMLVKAQDGGKCRLSRKKRRTGSRRKPPDDLKRGNGHPKKGRQRG